MPTAKSDPDPEVAPTASESQANADPDAEVALANAALADAHAKQAAEDADAADRALAEATKDNPSARICPHCHAEMVRHDDRNPHKAGAWHCSGCGACWAPGLKHMRSGHSAPTTLKEND